MLDTTQTTQRVVNDIANFDRHSGSFIERLLFNNSVFIICACAVLSVLLAASAAGVRLTASYERMLPSHHAFVENYRANQKALQGLGNSIQIAVEAQRGSIMTKSYMLELQKVSDAVYLLPYVDRPAMRSLWTSAVRWTGVLEDGLEGGAVMPDHFDGSPPMLSQLRANIERSGIVGQLVANNYRSTIILVPLLEEDPETHEPIGYGKLNAELERVRQRFTTNDIGIHITGFAKVQGDLIAGLRQLLLFFGGAILITACVLLAYTRCVRSMLVVVACSLVAVTWQVGTLRLLGFELNPYSVLVPFLIFAIGTSHGAQKMNGITQDIGRGTHRLVAARYTFRRLFLTGFVALVCDAVGFGVLAIVDVPVIRELALVASLGVCILIFTNLMLLPILLSYVGVSAKAAARSVRAEGSEFVAAGRESILDKFTRRPYATAITAIALALAVGGAAVAAHLKVGDLDPGAPELRAGSRYNRDVAFITRNFASSSDVLVVMVQTPDARCNSYEALSKVDELEWQLQQLPGVEATYSLAGLSKRLTVELNEGSLKWFDVVPTQGVLNQVVNASSRDLFDNDCSRLAVFVHLVDHKADTLERVVRTTQAFAGSHDTPGARFLLAAGSAGMEAATNLVVGGAMRSMLFWVYGAVIILCLLNFRSWRAVVAAILPLMLTSVLCEALMVALGLGVKVATLPVIALGVGIGVDYALYVLSVTLAGLQSGMDLADAYRQARLFTGKVVVLTALTLALAVGTWVFSPIKFQADMGVLLAFMFIWNMVGALTLVPALCFFLMPIMPVSDGRASPAAPSPRSLLSAH